MRNDDRIMTQAMLLADLLNLADQNREVLPEKDYLEKDVSRTMRKRTLSDSAIAKPHVGKATHAELDNLKPVNSRLSNLYCLSGSLI
jgi:hypothetical protein